MCDDASLRLQALDVRMSLTHGPRRSRLSNVGVFTGVTIWINMDGYTTDGRVNFIQLGVCAILMKFGFIMERLKRPLLELCGGSAFLPRILPRRSFPREVRV